MRDRIHDDKSKVNFMPVAEMRLLNIIGPMRELEKVVMVCGKSESFEPGSIFGFFKNTEKFLPVKKENTTLDLMKVLSESAKKIGKKIELSDERLNLSKKNINRYVNFFREKIEKRIDKIKKFELDLNRCRGIIANLENFRNLNVNLSDLFSCKYVKCVFGKIPKSEFEKLQNEDEFFIIEKFCEKDGFCFCIAFSPESISEANFEKLQNCGFDRIEIPKFDNTPEREIKELSLRCGKIKSEIDIIKEKLENFWNHQKNYCSRIFSHLEEIDKCRNIMLSAAQHKENFILSGWVPLCKIKEVTNKLDDIAGVEYSVESGNEILNFAPPVKLENKKIFSPFEFFVNAYGLPNYNGVDPTAFVAMTYTFLFGIMFADVGHGLLLSVAGFLMYKIKKSRLGAILVICGISSAVFGLFFGSVFGFENVLDPMYHFLGLKSKPIEIMNPSSTMPIIGSAMGIGIILLSLSMICNIMILIRSGKTAAALFSPNGVCGLVFYLSLVFSLMDLMFFKSGVFGTAFVIIFLILPIILIMFREALESLFEKKSIIKNWGDYILSGSFELLEIVLGYFTNTVSFARVGVFIFVHAGMMMVVFNLAHMSGNLAPAVIILGNLIVTILETLLVGMQIMRLEFCELFGRFFAGGGRSFAPVVIKHRLNN
jgi:V/A-type H+-transporting ATPase subunit I